jgi:ribosomal protein S6
MLTILNSDIPQNIYEAIEENVRTIVKNADGTIVTYDKWGKYLLAYKIKKSAYGIYVLIRFGVSKDKIKDLLNNLHNLCNLRYNNYIMRYVFVKLGKTIANIYCRPDSLEDAPRREKTYDIDDVISRKNKYGRKARNFNGAYLAETSDSDQDAHSADITVKGISKDSKEVNNIL